MHIGLLDNTHTQVMSKNYIEITRKKLNMNFRTSMKGHQLRTSLNLLCKTPPAPDEKFDVSL